MADRSDSALSVLDSIVLRAVSAVPSAAGTQPTDSATTVPISDALRIKTFALQRGAALFVRLPSRIFVDGTDADAFLVFYKTHGKGEPGDDVVPLEDHENFGESRESQQLRRVILARERCGQVTVRSRNGRETLKVHGGRILWIGSGGPDLPRANDLLRDHRRLLVREFCCHLQLCDWWYAQRVALACFFS